VTNRLFTPIACAGISHHSADVQVLETFRYDDEPAFLLSARERFKGVVLLQTCNRIEIFVQGTGDELNTFLEESGREGYTICEGTAVLRHLLELAAGMDSMIMGEDQILGQLKKCLALSQENGTCSPLIELCVTKAAHAGVEVRKKTQINKGAVSIGSAAVQLAEGMLGSLSGKHILVVGAGEMGKLVTQALAAKNLTAIYVTNRSFDRALELAEEIDGKAVKFDELYNYIALSDVIITCTAAPHQVIKCEPLCGALERRQWPQDEEPRPLIVIDIAQPRDVEECVCEIEGLQLYTIDDLRSVSEENHNARRREAEAAGEILDEEIEQFISLVNRTQANNMLARLYTWAEAIRMRERDRALSRIGNGNDEEALREIIDDLTRVLSKKLLTDVTFSVRSSAECGELEGAESLVKALTEGTRLCFHKDD